MFTLTVKMSLQMFYSNIMAHMPSAYGLGKNIIFNKVQFSSVPKCQTVLTPIRSGQNVRPDLDQYCLKGLSADDNVI